MTISQLIDARELAAKLKVPISWLYDRTRRTGPEQIPHYKLGKYVRFSESEVREYLAGKSASKVIDDGQ